LFLPTRSCIKKTGIPSSIIIIKAAKNKKGEIIISPTAQIRLRIILEIFLTIIL
jgi:hypothetical protein